MQILMTLTSRSFRVNSFKLEYLQYFVSDVLIIVNRILVVSNLKMIILLLKVMFQVLFFSVSIFTPPKKLKRSCMDGSSNLYLVNYQKTQTCFILIYYGLPSSYTEKKSIGIIRSLKFKIYGSSNFAKFLGSL